MTSLKLLGAAALLAAAVATPAMAQQAMQDPGAYSRHQRWSDNDNYRRGRDGFWPGEVAAGVVAGAVGTAEAVASAPFRNSNGYYRDSNAYYGGPAYGDSNGYYVERRISQRPACGIQPDATYMGPDGRWYPC